MNTLLKPFYAVVPLSLEELFAEELKKLGIEKFRLEKGGCWFGAEMSQMMQVNLENSLEGDRRTLSYGRRYL